MGIQSRSLEQQEFERALERSCPAKVRLVRANAYDCNSALCFANGRLEINNNCPLCAGTGYLGVSFINGVRVVTATDAPYDDTMAPASNTYLIYADVQTGHGLYGSGGDYLKLLQDIGKQDVGDATAFTKMFDRDHATGAIIFPKVDPTLVRPDRIISTFGESYNVVRQLIASIGSSINLGRIFTLEKGSFTAAGQGTR